MDSSRVLSLLEQLDDEIDDLEESLAPLLKTALSESAAKLPLLDKAKLYVLVTYAIESMLFSYLRLNGVKAREHPVFKELTRVKQYFDKIKVVETPVERNMTVDKGAAARFIKAGLAGNDRYDLERAEKEAKERARAHIKFEEASTQIVKKRKASETEQTPVKESDPSDSESISESSVEEAPAALVVSKKKRKLDNSKSSDSAPTSGASSSASGQLLRKNQKKQGMKEKKVVKSEKRKRNKEKKMS